MTPAHIYVTEEEFNLSFKIEQFEPQNAAVEKDYKFHVGDLVNLGRREGYYEGLFEFPKVQFSDDPKGHLKLILPDDFKVMRLGEKH